MAFCNAYLERRTLYRGQTRDYGSIASSSWRERWKHGHLDRDLQDVVAAFFTENLTKAVFQTRLAAVTAKAHPDKATFYRYLAEPDHAALLDDLLAHIQKSFGAIFRPTVARVQLEQLEQSFNTRFHMHLFNDSNDPFFRKFIPHTFRRLAEVTLEFYDADRKAFDVEYRIAQVVIDLAGVLQHYGVLGTPGLDLTEDPDVAIWFATHAYEEKKERYRAMEPDEWKDSVVYEFEVPVVTFSPTPRAGTPITALPRERVVNLSSLSRRFTRIASQKGWYAIDVDGWTRAVDFAEMFPVRRKAVRDYGEAAVIQKRMSRWTQDDLFPKPEKDPFRDHLRKHQIKTFL
jgi:hypothetical protein